jgi:DNA-binding NarL/FixJ family response regulator
MDCPAEDDRKGLLIAGLERRLLGRWAGQESVSSIRSVFAAGQQEAIQAAHRGRWELAVVNRRLPDGDGLTLTSLLKEILPDLTVIVTGEGCDREEEVKVYASGASLYLPYPVDAGLLVRVIDSCLRKTSRGPRAKIA